MSTTAVPSGKSASPTEVTVLLTSAMLLNALRFEGDCTIGQISDQSIPQLAKVNVGDRIVRVAGEPVSSRGDLRGALPSGDAPVEVVLQVASAQATAAAQAAAAQHQKNDQLVSVDEEASVAPSGPTESLRASLDRALRETPTARCLIAICDSAVSPLAEIELLARERQQRVFVVDFGVKLRNRIKKEDVGHAFGDAMRGGAWFVVLRGGKSLSMLETISGLLEELWANDLKGVDPKAKVIVATEPHPHFPPFLTKSSKSIRIRAARAESTPVFESIANSVSALRIVSDQTVSTTTAGAAGSAGGHVAAGAGAAAVRARPRRVRISATVDVVDIESREVFKGQDKPRPQVNVAGTVKLRHTFNALPQDKFFGIAHAGAPNRYAFSSSLGNVYIVDECGSSLLSFHVHDAAVWDVSFANEYKFVTGGEDGAAVFWQQDTSENNVLVPYSTLQCQHDVYAVRYTQNKEAAAIGGLMQHMTIRSASSGTVTQAELPTSLQAMCSMGPTNIVGGGGDGSVFVVDTTTATVVTTSSQHTKKAPAVAAADNFVISGSFDCTVRLWDVRTAPDSRSLHTMKFQHYVTGLDIDDNYLAACVGDNLYLWDVRNLGTVLGGFPSAWQGLSRAVKMTASTGTVVTASPDGVARFWSFGNS